MPAEPVPAVSPAEGPPLLALDRQAIALIGRRGDAATASVVVSNQGGAPLRGSVVVRLGAEWLQAEPSSLVVAPGETCSVRLHGAPSTASEQVLGEIGVITNGGSAVLPVTVRGTGVSVVALLPLVVVAVLLVGALSVIAVVASRQAAPPASTAPSQATTSVHRASAGRGHAAQGAGAMVGGAGALRVAVTAVARAVAANNAIWQAALTLPSAAALASSMTGEELRITTSEVDDLLAGGEQWQIVPRTFRVEPGSVVVTAGGASAEALADKVEQRALYAADRTGPPAESSTAAYRLRYHLVRRQGRWLVDHVTVLAFTPLQRGPALHSVEEVLARVLPEVVRIQATSADQVAVGTGFVVHSTAHWSYVVTNDHVVHGANSVQVRRPPSAPGAKGPWIASAVWEDAAADLAVVRIPRGNLPVAAWDDSGTLKAAEDVVAIGYAEDLGGDPTVTNGIVSSLHRTSPDAPSGADYIQHSAAINHGNSGGPLVDMSGHVVGINTWTLEGTQGLYFAIPSARAAPVVAGWTGSNG